MQKLNIENVIRSIQTKPPVEEDQTFTLYHCTDGGTILRYTGTPLATYIFIPCVWSVDNAEGEEDWCTVALLYRCDTRVAYNVNEFVGIEPFNMGDDVVVFNREYWEIVEG